MYDVRGSFRRYPIPCENRQRRGRGNCISPAHCKGSLLAIVTNCWLPIVVLCPSTPDSLNPSRLGGTHLPPPSSFSGSLGSMLAYSQGTKYLYLRRQKGTNLKILHVNIECNIYTIYTYWWIHGVLASHSKWMQGFRIAVCVQDIDCGVSVTLSGPLNALWGPRRGRRHYNQIPLVMYVRTARWLTLPSAGKSPLSA